MSTVSLRPLLSVLIPVYNEARTVAACIERVEAVPIDKEVIVVDDGSTDGTRDVLAELAANRSTERLRVVYQPRNMGKGAALRAAIALARGEISLVQDADLEYDPADYPALIAPIQRGETKVVYGSRRLNEANHYPLDRFLLGSLLLTWTTNRLYGAAITDEPTCYKVFDTQLLQSLPLVCQRFEFCPEVTAKVLRAGHHIVEVPIRYHKRSIAEGKKIRWHDDTVALWTLVRNRW